MNMQTSRYGVFLIVFKHFLYTEVKMFTFWSIWLWFIIYKSRQPSTSDFDAADLEIITETKCATVPVVKKMMLGFSAQQWHLVESSHTCLIQKSKNQDKIVHSAHIHFCPYLLVSKHFFSGKHEKYVLFFFLAIWRVKLY